MTESRIGVIVRCADAVRRVYDTLASVERQSQTVAEIVLVTDPSTPSAVRPWLKAMAEGRGRVLVDATSPLPGAVWNAGMAATAAEVVVCIAAGDVLDRDFVRTAVALMESTTAEVVTSSLLDVGPGSQPRVHPAIDWQRGPLIGAYHAQGAPLTMRRRLWSDLDGFDNSLSAYEDLDFCCRASAGRSGAMVRSPLVVRPYYPDAIHVQAWIVDQRSQAFADVVARHDEAVGEGLVDLLEGSERRRAELRTANQDLLAKRAADVGSLELLRKRADDLRASLSDSSRDTVGVEDLARTTPVSRDWGYDRGGPVDREYIEQFMSDHASDIVGVVLEVQEPDYTRRFGADKVTRSDVVDLDAGNARATIVTDLRAAANIASDAYDCIILTQTLHVIDDMPRVVSECWRILKPGGVILATLPAASRVCVEYGYDGDFWRVTEAGARHVFASVFPQDAIETQAVGNVRVTAAFLYGLGRGEVSREDYEANDPYYPMLITVRARKPGAASERRPRRASAGAQSTGAILLYHRVASPSTDVHHLSVTPADFRAQMEHLRDRYHPMPLNEFAEAAAKHLLPAGAVAVTFDDGYLDNLVNASPILTATGVPVTFFLTTDRLNTPYEFWWDALERMMLGSTPTPDQLAAHAATYDAIVGAPADVRDRAIEDLRARRGDSAHSEGARRMNAGEMVELSRRPGHAIGAHTVQHLMLTRQSDEVRRQEIEESRQSLENLIEADVTAFAYPFGAHDAQTRDAVRAAGFRIAVACGDSAIPTRPDLLALPRIDPAAPRGVSFDQWLRAICPVV